MTDQTANTLLQTLHDVCADLSDRESVICSIVTDKASNEIATVGDLRPRLDLPVFRVSCLSHITTLAVKDFLANAFPRIFVRISAMPCPTCGNFSRISAKKTRSTEFPGRVRRDGRPWVSSLDTLCFTRAASAPSSRTSLRPDRANHPGRVSLSTLDSSNSHRVSGF
jgi:hypothetical protein